MARLTPSKLKAALDALAAANNRAQKARDKIMAHCEAVYGVCPGDIDNDEFIDQCDGGCGVCSSMSAEEFDHSMREGMRRAGLSLPGTDMGGIKLEVDHE
jgi:hypothetical protein